MRSAGIRIGELSRRTGCSIETIRYYERIGLLPEPERTGRYRCYGNGGVRRLTFVRRARELGFTLDEVRSLLTLSANDDGNACAAAQQLGAARLTEVRERIADLRIIERILAGAVQACNPEQRRGCPLIEKLSDQRH
ncbi:MAG TPA: MerR family DNA-binding protein [Acetobacteraceae bacterium]|nr:MerR family DNA-binding protein [Acetobacteraceae bacterium]